MNIITKDKALADLKAIEVWPFWDGDVGHGVPIKEDRFYGFYDSGGVTDNRGFDTAEAAVEDAKKQLEDVYSSTSLVTTNPDQLGEYLVTVLSGRQFIDRMYELCDYNKELFDDYGAWSVPKAA